MKTKINKTNVARLLDKAKVPYELVPYEVDENDLSATHVAEQLGEDISRVFKTQERYDEYNAFFRNINTIIDIARGAARHPCASMYIHNDRALFICLSFLCPNVQIKTVLRIILIGDKKLRCIF